MNRYGAYMPFVITLTGPSGCGKSTIIDIFSSVSEKYKSFKPVPVPKFTTRAFRSAEINAVTNNEGKLDVLPVVGKYNNIENSSLAEIEDAKLMAFKNQNCDLAYEQYGNRYGIHMQGIIDMMKEGLSPLVILNDIRTVEDIKTTFGIQSKSLFIFREAPNLALFKQRGFQRNESENEVMARFEKAQAIYRIYIENIYLFDRLILNVTEDTEGLARLLEQFVRDLCKPIPKFN